MIYLLYGEDEYLRNEYLKKIKTTFGDIQPGISYVQVDETNGSNIILSDFFILSASISSFTIVPPFPAYSMSFRSSLIMSLMFVPTHSIK